MAPVQQNNMVCLNVGGTKYQVGRTTIEKYPNTMLARLVSDRWKEGKQADQEIFIDRDGPRFCYVLDYMRDQKVHLPVNYPKDSLLQDMNYYGFDNVACDAISSQCANFDAAAHMRVCVEEHADELANIDRNIRDLEELRRFKEMAFACYKSFSVAHPTDNGRVSVRGVPHHSKYLYDTSRSRKLNLSSERKGLFDECLSHYGLLYLSHDSLYVHVAPLNTRNVH